MKQDESKSSNPTADELGRQSAYEGATEMQRQMARGDRRKVMRARAT